MKNDLWKKFKKISMTDPTEKYIKKDITIEDINNSIKKLEELAVNYFVIGTKEELEKINIDKLLKEVNRDYKHINLEPVEIDEKYLPDADKVYLIKNTNKDNSIKVIFE